MQTKSDHYNSIRLIATLLVVFAHASRMYTGLGVVTPVMASPSLGYVTSLIYSFHMPLFLMLSGMVYGYCIDDLGKYNHAGRFIVKKAVRLLLPYFVFGLAYVAPVMCVLGFTQDSYFQYVYSGIILAMNNRHLWYLVVLFEIFLFCALAKKLLQKVPAIFMMIGFMLLSFVSWRFPVVFQITLTVYYFVFFYVGYLVNRYYQKIIRLIRHPVVMAAMLVVLIVLVPKDEWLLKIIKALAGSAFMIGVTSYLPVHFSQKEIVKKNNQNGFGIYLFHPMIIYALYFFTWNKNIPPWVLCLGITAISYLVSYGATELLRRIKLGVVIGE